MKVKVEQLVFKALNSLNDELKNKDLDNPTLETKIYGLDGNLDSLALVSFIADLEEAIANEFGVEVILADEKAMSGRNSPFKDVKTLVDYICTKVANG